MAEDGLDLSFAAVADSVADGLAVTDGTGTVLWANRAFCELSGRGASEVVGRTSTLLGAHRARVGSFEPEVRRQDDDRTVHVTWREDGTVLHYRIHSRPLPAKGRDLLLYSLRDVTAEVENQSRAFALRMQAERACDVTLFSLASVAEQRDRCTGSHLLRIESYTRALAEWMLTHLPEHLPSWCRDPRLIGRCSIVHDIGKVGVPDSVLQKPGRLTVEEQTIMREHPRLGADIIDRVIQHQPDSVFLRVARDIIACHHEAWDGSGYPLGLRENAIPITAQLVTVADVFDALTSWRPYKKPHTIDEAIGWILSRRGAQFGPLAVEAFEGSMDEIRRIHGMLGDLPLIGIQAPAIDADRTEATPPVTVA